MKKIFIILVLIMSTRIWAQELGENVYKEFIINGQKTGQKVKVYTIAEYDDKGHLIYENSSFGVEKWYEYDTKGNLIHEKWSSYNAEWWRDYDSKGNLIHVKYSNGDEYWYEYEYGSNKKIKRRIEYLYDFKENLNNDNTMWWLN